MKFNEKEIKKFKEQITKFVVRHGDKPDQKLCPTLYIMWNTKSGMQYKSLKTGRRYKKLDLKKIPCIQTWFGSNFSPNNTYVTARGSTLTIPYVKLDKTLKVAEISAISINTNSSGDAREFEFIGGRHFMSLENKEMWCTLDNGHLYFAEEGVLLHCASSKYGGQWYCVNWKIKTYINHIFHSYIHNDKAYEGLRNILICFNISEVYHGDRYVPLKEVYGCTFAYWVSRKENGPKPPRKAQEEVVKKIESAQLSDKAVTLDDIPNKDIDENKEDKFMIIKCEKIDDIAVLRLYYPRYIYHNARAKKYVEVSYCNGDTKYARMREVDRIYITPKTIMVYYNSGQRGFVRDAAVNPIQYVSMAKHQYLIDEDKIKDMPQFKYLKDVWQTASIESILAARKHPIIEQLLKIGCTTIATRLCVDNQVKANIKGFFGEANVKEKGLTKITGMSTKQLQYIEKMMRENKKMSLDLIRYVYYLCNKRVLPHKYHNMSHIDVKTLSDIMEIIMKLHDYYMIYVYNNRWPGYNPFRQYIPEDLEGMDRVKYITKMMKLCDEAKVGIRIIDDMKNMYNSLLPEFRPENFNLNFKCASDITRMHESLIELKRASDEERHRLNALAEEERNKELEKRMQKLQTERRKNTYEEDEYVIRIPEKLSELTTEGQVQRICIGGYTINYANGHSNIYFLRKKSEPNKPFFAIEEKDKNIVQIHGFGNKWLGSDDESFAAVPFVMRWLKKCGFKCSKEILTCQSVGYSQTNSYRELPQI